MNKNILIGAGVIVVAIILVMVLAAGEPAAPMSDTQTDEQLTSDAGEFEPSEDGVAPGYETFASLEGTWPGSWQNTTFGSEGEISVSVEVKEEGTATMTLDIGGAVFGLVDPDPMRLSGYYTANLMTFTGSSDLFGNFMATVDRDGTIALSAPEASAPGIASLVVNGQIDQETEALSGTYVVTFDGGGTAEGVIGF